MRVQLKGGTEANIPNYTGPAGELVIDKPNTRFYAQDGTNAGGTLVSGVTVIPEFITPPVIVSPVTGSINYNAFVLLMCTPYSGSGSVISADWEIATDIGFTNVVYSSIGNTVDISQHNPIVGGAQLVEDVTYRLRVRHTDDNVGVSAWSTVVSFTVLTNFSALEGSKLNASDAAAGDEFGMSVALSADGSLALIGAIWDDDNGLSGSGSVYVFTQSGGVWTEQQKLHASDPDAGDGFGMSVSLSGDGSLALIGAHLDNDNGLADSGSVYVFTRTGSTWTEQQKLHASDAAENDNFGMSVALSADGTLALIGAQYDDDNGLSRSGSVYVFTRVGTVWTEQQKLHASDAAVDDFFGTSVALSADGTLALIGARRDSDNGLDSSGSVYVFTRSGSTWTEQQKIHASDPAVYDYFGVSVALSADGGLALIGSTADDDNGLASSGSVYVFTRTGTVWTEQQKLHASDAAENDRLGRSCALSADGGLALIGVQYDDDNGLDNSGSVYVFN